MLIKSFRQKNCTTGMILKDNSNRFVEQRQRQVRMQREETIAHERQRFQWKMAVSGAAKLMLKAKSNTLTIAINYFTWENCYFKLPSILTRTRAAMSDKGNTLTQVLMGKCPNDVILSQKAFDPSNYRQFQVTSYKHTFSLVYWSILIFC